MRSVSSTPGIAAEELEALREQLQRRGLVPALGEAHEAPAAPGQPRTEDLHPVVGAPVVDEVLARRPPLPGRDDAASPAMLDLGPATGPAKRMGAEPV